MRALVFGMLLVSSPAFANGTESAESVRSFMIGSAAIVQTLTFVVAKKGMSADRIKVRDATYATAVKNGIPPEIFVKLVNRESGFNAKAVGPKTRYGRAYGPTQILASTAATMGATPRQLMSDYQLALDLGARYLLLGYRRYGNWRQAVAFYHGGPNERIHGTKTAAYARAIVG